ncbi:THO complex subunit 6 -like protein [Sarcoptes scabiei]|uniref:THO complex subunit 6 -like protein n=1 Tax=Sarcoptes scabiei TaxID=52283 RepID=A0A834RDA4_SARSC|nr:THO complex subunit 6 -like protein [Sarcoptes scabiei]
MKNFNEKHRSTLETYYTKIIAQTITKDGKFLLAICKRTKIIAFCLEQHLKEICHEFQLNDGLQSMLLNQKRYPIAQINVIDCLSLCLIDSIPSKYHFAVGGKGYIKGFELNAETINEFNEKWNITFSETLASHYDYIHDLKASKSIEPIFYSGSEDGTRKQAIERPEFGEWIGTIDVNDDQWLVCGGGPSLSVWHLKINDCAHIIKTPGVIYCSKFVSEDLDIIAAGDQNTIVYWERNHPFMSESIHVKSSIDTIYSMSHHNYKNFNYNLFSFCGDNHQIEICKNATHIDWKLSV